MAPEAPRDLDLLQAPPSIYLLPYHIAFIVDGTVEEIMHFDERTASLMLSNPTIKQVDLASEGGPDVGWVHNSETNTFSAPA
jgi:hypothetical protein